MSEILRSATSPLEAGKYREHGYRISTDMGMVIERDVSVPLRDGTRIFVDVYRPAAAGFTNGPALMGWSPYGKHGFKNLSLMPGSDVDPSWVSPHVIWEGPDPVHWCAQGYVIVNPDPRGAWRSEGTLSFWTESEARDGYDVIEWAATQPWSNGRVGLLGVSYLAISQWMIAAQRPPHLAAICPWEGVSDVYRDLAFHGGIPERGFLEWWQPKSRFSLGPAEDLLAMHDAHPLFDSYWADKKPDLSQIIAPAYVVASWCDHGMHTRGTLEGFKQIGSREKWLEIHGRKKWKHFWHPESVERQQQFFDQFLKGIESGVSWWPRVRLEVRGKPEAFRDESEWPLARTVYTKLYLNVERSSLEFEPLPQSSEARYSSDGAGTRLSFVHIFSEPAELTGHMKLKLWVSAETANDMDIFVAIQKRDRNGAEVGFPFFSTFDKGPVALGWLRVSHRELDPERSTDFQPWLLHQEPMLLEPGETVPVEIEILPSSTSFERGECLRLVIQGTDIYQFDSSAPQDRHRTCNSGVYLVHGGGIFDSHLVVPLIPTQP